MYDCRPERSENEMKKKALSAPQGWPLVGAAASVVFLSVALVVLTSANPVEAARSAIRITARFSIVLFLLAFTASAVWRFWPNAWTSWQRRNRRYFGVSFAVSHFTHLAAIAALRRVAPEELAADANAITWIFGGLAYVFIAAMTLTSFDRTAQMLGPRAWSLLHTAGSYYIWLIFANSYIARAVQMPEYVPIAILVVSALVLRIAARVSRSRAQQPAVTS
jgi:sulfoxide reductase heme-binding subunit YedZ